MEQIIKNILEYEKMPYKQIKKATSGFTNLVYFIDDNFVIKMSNSEKTKKKIEKETSIYKNITLNCTPQYIASGEFQDFKYLIISKIEGNSLYSIWHTLSKLERENCVRQIAKILKEFNNQNADFLADEYKDLDWVETISSQLQSKVDLIIEMGYNLSNINSFISHDLPNILSQNNYGLVYNDAHFDNFIYDEGKLYLIDFDRVRFCPIDYEMLIFKTMCDNPSKFASEEDENKIKEEDYIGIYEIFRKEYPEMFRNEYVEKRIETYQFIYLIGQAINCKNKAWIDELLARFEK